MVGKPTYIPDCILEKYGVKREDVESMHKNWKLYGSMVVHSRVANLTPEDKLIYQNRSYYCEPCAKHIRKINHWQHQRTKTHQRLSRDTEQTP